MVIGFLGYAVSQLVLITAPELGYVSLVLSAFLQACSLATINPLVHQLTTLAISASERARIQSLLYAVIILLMAPFGWIAGVLSEIDKRRPFVLSMTLFAVAAVLAYIAGSHIRAAPVKEDEPSGDTEAHN